jgi:hypothetical protein
LNFIQIIITRKRGSIYRGSQAGPARVSDPIGLSAHGPKYGIKALGARR